MKIRTDRYMFKNHKKYLKIYLKPNFISTLNKKAKAKYRVYVAYPIRNYDKLAEAFDEYKKCYKNVTIYK